MVGPQNNQACRSSTEPTRDTWFAWLNELLVDIAPEKIVKDFSPTGEALLFMLADNPMLCVAEGRVYRQRRCIDGG